MDRRCYAGHGFGPGRVDSDDGSLTGDTTDGWFQSDPLRLHLEPASVPRPDYGDRFRVPTAQGGGVPKEGLLVDHRNSGSPRICDRFFLRQPLLYFLKCRGDVADRSTCTP